MICPICKDDLLGRARCSSSYCEGYRDGRDDGYDSGLEAAARVFWRHVCERLAREAEVEAASLEGDAGGYPQMSAATRGWYWAEAIVKANEAAQLRKWASE